MTKRITSTSFRYFLTRFTGDDTGTIRSRRHRVLYVAVLFLKFQSQLTKPETRDCLVWITGCFGKTAGAYPKQFRNLLALEKKKANAKMVYIEFFLHGPLGSDVARQIAGLAV